MSTGELEAAVRALSAEISGAPLAALLATPSLGTVVATLAGLLSGVPITPVPADAGPIERQHILRDSGASLMIVPADGAGSHSVPLAEVTPVSTQGGPQKRRPPAVAAEPPSGSDDPPAVADEPPSGSDDPPAVADEPPAGSDEPVPDDPVLIMYTSGTTGAPKGVPITAGAISADLDALAEAWDWTAEDVLVHGLPLSHVHGLILGILGPLRAASRLVHTGRPTPQSYAAAADDGGTLFFGVPTVWARMAADKAASRAMRRARLLVSGSAGLPLPVSEQLMEASGHRVIERYGMTETLITLAQRADEQSRPGWVGRSVAGTETRICGDDDELLPADSSSVGALEVRGPTVMRGYVDNPDADRAVFRADGWFRTGDAAVSDADGAHRILGRVASDLIKSGGHRIGAGEVEAALLSHRGVREAAVIGVPDDDLGQAVVAYVVADGVSDRQLIDFVAQELSNHKRPRRVHFVAELPRNSMGKIRKDQLG